MKIAKKLILCMLILGINYNAFAQKSPLDKIKTKYYQVNEQNEYYSIHTVTLNSMLPAVGLQTKTIKFYYQAEQLNPEEDPYLMKSKLAKIEVDYTGGSHTTFRKEYLFDENQELIFCFEKAEGAYQNYQKRYYFDTQNLIKTIVKMKNEGEKEASYDKTSNFTDQDKKNVLSIKERIIAYKTFFTNLLAVEKLED